MKYLLLSVALVAMCGLSSVAATASDGVPSDDRKDYFNSVKITFLSWLSGSTKVSYERAFPQLKQSGELCTSLISAGYDKYDNDPLGFTVRYGHKFFMFDNDDVSLKGFYLRPELMYSHYYYSRRADGARTLEQSAISIFGIAFWLISGSVQDMLSELLLKPTITTDLNSGTGLEERIRTLP